MVLRVIDLPCGVRVVVIDFIFILGGVISFSRCYLYYLSLLHSLFYRFPFSFLSADCILFSLLDSSLA